MALALGACGGDTSTQSSATSAVSPYSTAAGPPTDAEKPDRPGRSS
jgi:hypothetical protein